MMTKTTQAGLRPVLKERKLISATLNKDRHGLETVVVLADNNGVYENATFFIDGDGWNLLRSVI